METTKSPISYVYIPPYIPNPKYLGEYKSSVFLPIDATDGDFADVSDTQTEWQYGENGWENTNNPIGTTSRETPNPDLEDEDKLDMSNRQTAILNQIKENCPEPELTDAQLWGKLWVVLRRLSLITCWGDKQEDTFIEQVRKQIYDGKQKNLCCQGHCEESTIKIPLEYEPIADRKYISGEIKLRIEGRFIKEDITPEYLEEHTDWDKGILYIDVSDFLNTLAVKTPGCCGCLFDYSITLLYNAGYATIPSSLVPIICNLISKTDTATNGDCASSVIKTTGLLRRKKTGNVEYEWGEADLSSQSTDRLMNELVALGFLDDILTVARCDIAEGKITAGDVV